MKLYKLRCEYRNNPIGIDILKPRLSWKLISDRRGAYQKSYQVVAASDRESLDGTDTVLWDSGKVESDQSIHIPYGGVALQSRQRVYWKVRVWDENDQATEWSNPAWFEMGLLSQDEWQAQWIGNPLVGGPRTSVPSPYFRKSFSIQEEISSARLYITALGIYEAFINGQRVGEDIFTPGWTDYTKRVQYQTYDVTDLFSRDVNVIGAVLGDGWYCGHVAWEGRQFYGDRPKLLAQLEITFADGNTQTLTTDETWQTATGPILEADMVMGESYDARLEVPAWNVEKGDDASGDERWSPAVTFSHPANLALVAQNSLTVRTQEELTPINDPIQIQNWPQPKWIYDFGQNLVGRVRLKVEGLRGTTITLRYGEMLDENHRLYTDNLRTARQIDNYTLKGDPEGEVWESSFTFHGFRYVELQGLPHKPSPDALTAIVLHSENPSAFEFECSEPLINQLQHNICWGWKGNAVDVPTDCPQRDERLGWTGDAQVFVKTATYISDAASFFTKWIHDMADAQLESGAIPSVAPNIFTRRKADGGAAWSDAFVIVPWTIWQQYGDAHVLETHYEAMCRYMDYLVENSPGLIRLLPNEKELGSWDLEGVGGYGDWLAQDGSANRRGLTPRDLIGTAFLAYDAKLMSQIAAVIGREEDAEKFDQLFADTRTAFVNRFLTPDGLMAGQTQTGFILALYFGLVPEDLRSTVIFSLTKDIEVTRNMHMSTGFVGTPYICQVLTDAGRLDLAYALLLQKTFPSWLYSVLHGATTIWERWDGWTEEKGFHDPSMNSFNHYAYGAIGTWMYENITGIRTNPDAPGFKHVLLQPRLGGGLTYANGQFQSPYGLIGSHWQLENDCLRWNVILPPNTTATAHIPATHRSRVLEGSNPFKESPGVKFLHKTDDAVVVALQSGRYNFRVERD